MRGIVLIGVLSSFSAQALSGGAPPGSWAHWGLNETEGTLAFDAANGYYGTYLGEPTLGLPGAFNPCSNFAVGLDGVDDSVRMDGFGTSLNMGVDSFTVVARFRKTSSSTSSMKIFNKGMTFVGTPPNNGYALRILSGNLEFHWSDGGPTFSSISVPEPTVDEWHFVAGVIDRDAGVARLHVDPSDALPTAMVPVLGLGSLDTNIEFAIGALDRTIFGVVTERFVGEIDHVTIYRTALTGEQVLALATPCTADLAAPFGLLDLSDVTAFVQAFVASQATADLALPCGVFDLDDLIAFVVAFEAGCN